MGSRHSGKAKLVLALGGLGLLLSAFSTRHEPPATTPEPPEPPAVRSIPLPSPPERVPHHTVEPLEEPVAIPVGGDLPAHVLPGSGPRTLVYLHGWCGDPKRVREWGGVTYAFGTLVALHGDQPCRNRPGRRRWSADPKFLDYRIDKALREIASHAGLVLDPSDVTLIGYSEGAQRAEDLTWVYPERYRRVALMSGPNLPEYSKLKRTERVVVSRGSREYQRSYREAVDILAGSGIGVQYLALPGAAHGQFGDDPAESLHALLRMLHD